MTSIIRWLLAILSAYRLAQMVSKDDGPMFLFARLREYTDAQRAIEQDKWFPGGKGPWASLDEGLRCPYCTGVWFAALCLLFVRKPSRFSDFLLGWFGLAGAQTLLQAWTDKEGYL